MGNSIKYQVSGIMMQETGIKKQESRNWRIESFLKILLGFEFGMGFRGILEGLPGHRLLINKNCRIEYC